MAERIYYTAHEIHELTGWCIFTIYKKSSRGEIPGRCKLGASLRFQASEIDHWLRRENSLGDSNRSSTEDKINERYQR
jgi:predicted DNA-binding transcriptional regulator AlpA